MNMPDRLKIAALAALMLLPAAAQGRAQGAVPESGTRQCPPGFVCAPAPAQRVPPGYYRNDTPGAIGGGSGGASGGNSGHAAGRSGGGIYTNELPRQNPPANFPAHRNVSCETARQILLADGYRRIRTAFCFGSQYGFRAKRGGTWYFVVIRRSDGRIVSVQLL
ncbi:MAG: hypothetical protein KDJ80_06835 [Nitratireductor sp.]|nr:hypothetical protein [Nitratireductor sp.]